MPHVLGEGTDTPPVESLDGREPLRFQGQQELKGMLAVGRTRTGIVLGALLILAQALQVPVSGVWAASGPEIPDETVLSDENG